MNEETVSAVSPGPASAPPGFGLEDGKTLDTSFWDSAPFPPDYSILAFRALLVVALLILLVCVWIWIRNRHSRVVCARCRIVLSATSVTLLYVSAVCFLLDMAEIMNSLEGAGPSASHLLTLAYSLAMQLFGYGFAGFFLTGLLALLMGLFEPRAPATLEGPVART